MGVHWDDVRVADLKSMKADGLSASEIAAAMGGGEITRSAVIGKLFRLGLSAPRKIGRAPRRAKTMADQDRAVREKIANVVRRATQKAEARPPADNTLERLRTEIPPAEFLSIPFDALTPESCRFPRGEGPYTFCGQRRIKDSSYCASCFRLSTNPECEEVEA